MSFEPPAPTTLLPAGYADIPLCVRQYTTPREWLWLSDAEKARLIQSETEPDEEQ